MQTSEKKPHPFIYYLPQQICSRLLFEEDQYSASLYTMDAGESISEEKNDSRSLYVVLEGTLQINLLDQDQGEQDQIEQYPIEHNLIVQNQTQHVLQSGQAICIPFEHCHSIHALAECAYIKLQEGGIIMKNPIINKLPHNEVISLADAIEYVPHQVTSKTIVQRAELGMTLFAVDQGQQIKRHVTAGDALAQILHGSAEIEIGDQLHTVHAGQSIIMPAGIPHALYGKQAFKMLLVVVKSPKQ